MPIWISKLIIIDSDHGLSPNRRQAIIWTNAEILLIWPSGKHNQNSYIFIQENAFENICKMAAILSRPHWVKGLSLPDEPCYAAACYSAIITHANFSLPAK